MKVSYTLKLSALVVIVCCFRFLLDGVEWTLFGHPISFGHVDPLAYGSILTPVLGAHGYIHSQLNKNRTGKLTRITDKVSGGNIDAPSN